MRRLTILTPNYGRVKMYGKLFASLYQGTLRGKPDPILVFTNMIAYADAEGFVDKHPSAIADETGLTIDRVKAAIDLLMSPDAESRSPDLDGKRLVLMDEHRNWGWRIVNHGKYRAIRSEEDRREQNRLAQERWRLKNKHSKPSVSSRKQNKPKQKQEEEEEAKADVINNMSASRGRSNPEYPDQFEQFWNAFPRQRRTKKQEAFRKWKLAIKQVDADTLTQRAAEYAASDVGRGQFAVMPSVWLNGGCWEDELEAWQERNETPKPKKLFGS